MNHLKYYYIATGVLLLVGLILLLLASFKKKTSMSTSLLVLGIVCLLSGLTTIVVGYKSEAWAPPIMGNFFLGLASPEKMAKCNRAQLAAKEKDTCQQCVSTAQVCMRYPQEEKCRVAKEECQSSHCSEDIKDSIMFNC